MPKAKETRAHIIEKTAAVFNVKGFVGTTLSDMEKATGLTKGSIYNNFKNKDEVALAVFDYNVKGVTTFIKAEIDKATSAKDQLLVYTNVYSQSIFKAPFPIGGCAILNTAVECDDTHPELKKKARGALLGWKNTLVKLIEKGIKNKEFRSSINAEEIALIIIAMIEGAIMVAKITDNAQHQKTIVKAAEKIILSLK